MPWKLRSRPKEMRFSRDLRLKKNQEELNKNTLRLWEWNFLTKSMKNWLFKNKEKKQTKRKEWNKNYWQLKSTKDNSKFKEKKKRTGWKKSSKRGWWKSLLKMTVLSKWMPRKEEWKNRSTKEKSSDFGKKNYLLTEHRENKNSKRRDGKKKRNAERRWLLRWRRKDFLRNMLLCWLSTTPKQLLGMELPNLQIIIERYYYYNGYSRWIHC